MSRVKREDDGCKRGCKQAKNSGRGSYWLFEEEDELYQGVYVRGGAFLSQAQSIPDGQMICTQHEDGGTLDCGDEKKIKVSKKASK